MSEFGSLWVPFAFPFSFSSGSLTFRLLPRRNGAWPKTGPGVIGLQAPEKKRAAEKRDGFPVHSMRPEPLDSDTSHVGFGPFFFGGRRCECRSLGSERSTIGSLRVVPGWGLLGFFSGQESSICIRICFLIFPCWFLEKLLKQKNKNEKERRNNTFLRGLKQMQGARGLLGMNVGSASNTRLDGSVWGHSMPCLSNQRVMDMPQAFGAVF